MMPGLFQRNLRKLNKELRIFCGDSETTPAGLYRVTSDGEYEELCGVDKNDVREWPTYTRQGKMVKGGWHRVLTLLISKNLINKEESYRYFDNWELHRPPVYTIEKTDVDAAICSMEARPVTYKTIESPLDGSKVTVPVYHPDDIVDIGRMVKAETDQRCGTTAFTESVPNLEV